MHEPVGRDAAVMGAIIGLRRTFAKLNRILHDESNGQLSIADALILHHVLHAGRTTPGELRELTGLTSGAVTSAVGRMEAAGYLERKQDPDDGRVVRIGLVPGALGHVMQAFHQAHESAAQMFSGWTDAEIARLSASLEKF